MDAQQAIRPVILSGGAGTRLWPLSRRVRPKQLMALAGLRPMVVDTAARVGDPRRFLPPLIVAGADHGRAAEALLATAAFGPHADRPQPPAGLILEPEGRNTAPAIALAAHWVAARDGAEALLLVMPSDHAIADRDAFLAAVAAAIPLAQAGWLVTFGIAPDRPETGYGYIERGAPLGAAGFAVARFVEKPNRATAEAYLATGRFDWNAGIFLLRADALLAALASHAPEVASAVAEVWQLGPAPTAADLTRTGEAHPPAAAATGRDAPATPALPAFQPRAEAWTACPAIAIDVAVMERHDRVAVVPVSMGWSDVGSFDVLAGLGPCDGAGNALAGAVVALDCSGSLVRAEPGGPMVAALGVSNLCIIAMPDAVLVLPRERAQEVRRIVEALRAAGRDDLL